MMKISWQNFKKTIAILLCIIMLACFLPTAAFAEAVLQKESSNTYETEESVRDTYVLGEMTDSRTPESKTFRMSDGKFVIAEYPVPVHFKSEDGTLTDYDNTLIRVEPKDNNGFAGYENKQSNIKIRFAKTASDDGVVKIQMDDFGVDFGALYAEKSVNIKIADMPEAKNDHSIEAASELPRYSSSVTYSNVWDGVSLEYVINGGNLKENIIVDKKSNKYQFAFGMKLDGLAPIIGENGNILINDDCGNTLFTIPAGYMYDANGEYSDKVAYSLSEDGDKYIFTVSADAEWINAEERSFPVCIDPSVYGFKNGSDTYDTQLSQADPNGLSSDYYLTHRLTAGFRNNYDNYILIAPQNLIPIPESAVVTDAYFSICVSSFASGSRNDDVVAVVTAHPITSAWTSSGVTWNTQPAFSTEALDFMAFYSANSYDETYVNFNITRLVQQWYSGTANNGVLLKTSGSSDGYVIFRSSDSSVKPKLYIEYRDTKGIEDYWDYVTQGAGAAGNGYINAFNGNLTFVHGDISTNDNLLPLTVSHVFNTSLAKTDYLDNMRVGYGWKLSVQETIRSEVIDGATWYIHNDSDGTDHYFYQIAANEYADEDGMGLTLTVNTSSTSARYTIADEYGNKKQFNSSGYITNIVDIIGNKKTFVYSSNKLTSVKYTPLDGSTAIQLNFAYYSGGALKTITNASDSSDYVTFKYSSTYNSSYSTSAAYGYLRYINYTKGGVCVYNYDANGNIKEARDYTTDNYIEYYYDSYTYSYGSSLSNTRYRVSKVREYGYDDVIGPIDGQEIRLAYSDKKLEVRMSGWDDLIGNTDDILTTYVLDDYGREICSYTSDLNGNTVYGTSHGQYEPMEQGSKKNNKINVSSAKGTNVFNLLKNGNLESLTSWTGYVSGSGYSSAISSEKAFFGAKSVKVISNTTSSGSSYRRQSVNIPSEGKYTLSAYVKLDDVASASHGAYVSLGGTKSEYVKGTTKEATQNGWQRISVTKNFTSSGSYTVEFGLQNAKGTVYFDCIQLEKGEAPSNYNIIENGDMSLSSGWNGLSSHPDSERRAVNVIGDPTDYNYHSQRVELNIPKNTTLMLSGWGKAISTDIGPDSNDNNRTFRIVANIHYADGTVEDQAADFNHGYTGWQYTCAAIVPEKDISYAIIYLSYDFNINDAWFDDVCLSVEPAQTYKYDENGNVVSAENNFGESLITRSGVDVSETNSPIGEQYEYTYLTRGSVNTHLTETVKQIKKDADGNDYDAQTLTYSYNNQGKVTGSVLSAYGTTETISSSAAYTSDGLYNLASVTDTRGKVTSYGYENVTKLLSFIEDANHNRTAYHYDTKNRLIAVFDDNDADGISDSGEASVGYVYYNDMLSRINTDTTEYRLEYDCYGNIERIKAGDKILATYDYKNCNGKLQSVTYGNGYTESYEYDALDRLVAVKYNNTVAYTIVYTGEGDVYSVTDACAGIIYLYEYDGFGRLVRARQKKTSTGAALLMVENEYDEFGRLVGCDVDISGESEHYGKEYLENSPLVSSLTLPDGSVDYTYDEFERLHEKDVGKYRIQYKYINGTQLVSRYDIFYGNGTSDVFLYTYDDVGNIIREYEGSAIKKLYEYDSLNRLVRETNNYNGTATVWAYDDAGNITGKFVSNNTSATTASLLAQVGSGLSSDVSYTYSSSSWGDLLTSYNGVSISYDNIGNPLNWRNAYSLEWAGKRLDKINYTSSTTNEEYSEFTYNKDGIRTRKYYIDYVDCVMKEHDYVLDGTNIVKETYHMSSMFLGEENVTLYYYYDESGVSGFKYNGTDYWYVKNLQGDVIRIVNTNGVPVVNYVYDAWGNIVSVTGSLASSVGEINPFRYRGYYYDTETGWYYLNSRYYDPQVGRFINADEIIGANGGILGYNLFAYCDDNPVMLIDTDGYYPDFIMFEYEGKIGFKKRHNIIDKIFKVIVASNNNIDKAIALKIAKQWTSPVDHSDYHNDSPNAAFGAIRSNGRKHKGVDFYPYDSGVNKYGFDGSPQKVYAMFSGRVVYISSHFYEGTGAVYIYSEEYNILAIYGEISPQGLKIGDFVESGTMIGEMTPSSGKTLMLHLELYIGEKRNNSAILNPTFTYELLDGRHK